MIRFKLFLFVLIWWQMNVTAATVTNQAADSVMQITESASPLLKKINSRFDQNSHTIYLALKRNADVSKFNPAFKAPKGYKITPKGKQNFSRGEVIYSISGKDGNTLQYKVKAEVNGNPVVEGFFADPEILYSEKTGKFYIYPTTDGFAGWGGYTFSVFSSADLVNWKNEGVIINMHDTTQIKWANANAWAPCIVEKKIVTPQGIDYKYIFFFSGGLNGGSKKLGYAVADHPTGPFKVAEQPLLTSSPTGKGQQIDADVFTDPVSGKTFLYWGNGYMAVAELSNDMTLATQPQVITPARNYTEGTYVFYRKGRYYFMWSHGNTSNAEYKVYYGYADTPTGPITIPENNCVLIKLPEEQIYGPGHNAVVQIPGKDEWYMVYHRISRPNGIFNKKPGPGNVRELCIDKLEFNADGSIQPVIPTIKGISPVKFSKQ